MGQFRRRLVPDKRPDFTLESAGTAAQSDAAGSRGFALVSGKTHHRKRRGPLRGGALNPGGRRLSCVRAPRKTRVLAWSRSLYAGGCSPQGTACPVARRRGAALQWRHVGGAKRALALGTKDLYARRGGENFTEVAHPVMCAFRCTDASVAKLIE